jgi:hypothetical protein
MTDDLATLALAEALHDSDDYCNAQYRIPFEECVTKNWGEERAAEMILGLRALGWMLVRDPAGTIPLGLGNDR